jgi:hypothetical protein
LATGGRASDKVNIEVDQMARYAARLMESGWGGALAQPVGGERTAGRGLPDRVRNAIRHRLVVTGKADAGAGDEIAVTVHPG